MGKNSFEKIQNNQEETGRNSGKVELILENGAHLFIPADQQKKIEKLFKGGATYANEGTGSSQDKNRDKNQSKSFLKEGNTENRQPTVEAQDEQLTTQAEEKKSNQNKNLPKIPLAENAFKKEQLTTAYWMKRLEGIPGPDKISNLYSSIEYLKGISASENIDSKSRKKANQQIKSLQKTIKNLKNTELDLGSQRSESSLKASREQYSDSEKEKQELWDAMLGQYSDSEREDIIKRMQTKKELKNIRSKLKKESLLSKNKKDINEFEEFQKSIGDVKEKKYNHGAIRDAYLTKLGWEIKYNALNSKAWLVDKEGNYIDRNGNTTKNKKERREFKTQWEITKETDFIKFLREQTKKRFSEIEYSPEEEVLAKRETNKKEEYSPEELELSDRLAKEKEVKEVEYSPEEEMTAREATEPKEEYVIKNKQKKPSLWKRFTKSIKRLFSKEKNS